MLSGSCGDAYPFLLSPFAADSLIHHLICTRLPNTPLIQLYGRMESLPHPSFSPHPVCRVSGIYSAHRRIFFSGDCFPLSTFRGRSFPFVAFNRENKIICRKQKCKSSHIVDTFMRTSSSGPERSHASSLLTSSEFVASNSPMRTRSCDRRE